MRDNREVKRRKTGEVPYMGFNDKKNYVMKKDFVGKER